MFWIKVLGEVLTFNGVTEISQVSLKISEWKKWKTFGFGTTWGLVIYKRMNLNILMIVLLNEVMVSVPLICWFSLLAKNGSGIMAFLLEKKISTFYKHQLEHMKYTYMLTIQSHSDLANISGCTHTRTWKENVTGRAGSRWKENKHYDEDES